MAPHPKVLQAFRAMREIGIPEEKTKPVLKNLVILYEKKWELIEAENYRALADAIFEAEETEALENKIPENTEVFNDACEEPERPLKRSRLQHQEGQSSNVVGNSSLRLNEVQKHDNTENTTCENQLVSPQLVTRNSGKQPVSPKLLVTQDRSESPDVPMRSDTNLVRTRDKGKGPLLPQNAAKEKRIITERSNQGIRFKSPHIGVTSISKQKSPVARALIKPKDEPVTDELPLAVILPETLSNTNTSGNVSMGEPRGHVPESIGSTQSKDGSDGTPGELRMHHEVANIPAESAGNLEIALLPAGEVKNSVSCNSASVRPNSHMSNLDAVVKDVEDKCLKSYKVIDPDSSVKKLTKDMSSDALGDISDMSLCPISQLLDGQSSADVAQIPASPTPEGIENEKETEYDSQNDKEMKHSIQKDFDGETDMEMEHVEKNIIGNGGDIINEETKHNGGGHSKSQTLGVVNNIMLDIAKGQERVAISLINEINGDSPQSFHYIPQNVVFRSACAKVSLARIKDDNCCPTCDGDCLLSPTPCRCTLETGGDFVYTVEGLLKEEFIDECVSLTRGLQKHSLFYCKECPLEILKNEPVLEQCKGHLGRKFIKECWWKCGCSKQCGNRVVQRGISCNLQVFMTPGGKGWGLRCLDELPKGSFVCEYVGEVLTSKELYNRVFQSSKNKKQAYPVLLDADWGSRVLKDEETLCLDATEYGNISRFINHRCFDSNLVEIPVEVETPERHYYRLALFTTRKVAALEELTWDYGIDFDDEDHPVKAFQCTCGSNFCRNIKRSSRSRSLARI